MLLWSVSGDSRLSSQLSISTCARSIDFQPRRVVLRLRRTRGATPDVLTTFNLQPPILLVAQKPSVESLGYHHLDDIYPPKRGQPHQVLPLPDPCSLEEYPILPKAASP